jgi:hypothetical protein
LISVIVLFAVNVLLAARLTVYREDKPWNSGINWAGEKAPLLDFFPGGDRFAILVPATYTARGRRLLPWLWIAQAGLVAAILRLVFA